MISTLDGPKRSFPMCIMVSHTTSSLNLGRMWKLYLMYIRGFAIPLDAWINNFSGTSAKCYLSFLWILLRTSLLQPNFLMVSQ